ncbi:MupG family TIM beta-alpha barrel fold protein [Virgibacillus sp. 179-BFC.A HS]|uniref:MupG family TIM beta-alpha barrel fold protein n=1 Tax=Tigheibacillus jepli TaxID=3035914 RepID=A0ABU5CJG6_9BACI|nr:MupG family TIM beta-alpha barrel fold protein [Virgibacillus sp. 179-BFC.A HS]MDY0406492.1 MupG family TIM beta-alpha barrel fold protein [Virgibacillus sp. 179-BFC.A HS]
MLGISVYLAKDKQDFNKKWIKKAIKNGFSSIFTSLHIPEENPAAYKYLLQDLGDQAKNNGLDLIVDISPDSFRHIGLDVKDVEPLSRWGATGIRVDYGFTAKEIVDLSNRIKVFLNASTLTEKFLKELVHLGLNTKNTIAAHNFYPRPETGLSTKYVIKKNRFLKRYNIGTLAFIPGDGEKRQPLYEGLPTVESHRYESPVYAYLDLTENCLTDDVYVGDPSLTDQTLFTFKLLSEGIIPLKYKRENESDFKDFHVYLEEPKSNRLDAAQDVIRLEGSRVDLHNHGMLSPKNTIPRKKGAITIDNERYGRYAGEIHIALKDLDEDPKVNVIGHVVQADLPLLDYIHGGTAFILKQQP